MRRAGRIIYNLATAVSLLLCLASVVLWMRSYCVGEQISWCIGSNSWFVTSGHGEVMVVVAHGDAMSTRGRRWDHIIRPPFPALPVTGFNLQPRFLGFLSGKGNVTPEIPFDAVSVPWWPSTVVTGLLVIFLIRQSLIRRRKNLRKRQGLCARCGYDLRTTPDRCPECGTIPVKDAA
jgi:hypothetical protein